MLTVAWLTKSYLHLLLTEVKTRFHAIKRTSCMRQRKKHTESIYCLSLYEFKWWHTGTDTCCNYALYTGCLEGLISVEVGLYLFFFLDIFVCVKNQELLIRS